MIDHTKFISMNTGIKFHVCTGIFCGEVSRFISEKKGCLHRYDFTIKLRTLGLYAYRIHNARGVFLLTQNLHKIT